MNLEEKAQELFQKMNVQPASYDTQMRKFGYSESQMIGFAVAFTESQWVSFSYEKPESHPPSPGKYLVVRKDGKTHWETWNGSGWAYNGNVIRYWKDIHSPKDLKLQGF